jgi:3-methyladenine DNA glycosylase AlkD
LEEKFLAAKILGRISRKDPELTLALVDKFVDSITNWAVCDTLATQSQANIQTKTERDHTAC